MEIRLTAHDKDSSVVYCICLIIPSVLSRVYIYIEEAVGDTDMGAQQMKSNINRIYLYYRFGFIHMINLTHKV